MEICQRCGQELRIRAASTSSLATAEAILATAAPPGETAIASPTRAFQPAVTPMAPAAFRVRAATAPLPIVPMSPAGAAEAEAPPSAAGTLWVDEALLALCNAAHEEAARSGTAEVEIAHLMLVVSGSAQHAGELLRAGFVGERTARVARELIILAERGREGTPPRTSAQLRQLLARSMRVAEDRGAPCASLAHLIEALADRCDDLQGASRLLCRDAPLPAIDEMPEHLDGVEQRPDIRSTSDGSVVRSVPATRSAHEERPAVQRAPEPEMPVMPVHRDGADLPARMPRSEGLARLDQARGAAATRRAGRDAGDPAVLEAQMPPRTATALPETEALDHLARRLDTFESVLATLLARLGEGSARDAAGVMAREEARSRADSNGDLRRQWRVRRIGPFGPFEDELPAAAAPSPEPPMTRLSEPARPHRDAPPLIPRPPSRPHLYERQADNDLDEGPDELDEREKRFYLSIDDPIVRAPSIGPKTAARLAPFGIHRVGQLLSADPARLAGRIGLQYITARRVAEWQAQARLVCTIPWLRGTHAQLLVGAGYDTLVKLRGADLASVCAAVLRFSSTRDGQSVLRAGSPPDMERIGRWLAQVEHAEPQRAA